MIKEDGYGRYAMSTIRALMSLGVDVYPNLSSMLEMPGWMWRAAGFDDSRLTITIMPPHHSRAIAGRQWDLTMYEATRVPDEWIEHLNDKYERLIVPAPFLVDVFREQGTTIPIHIVPGGVDIEEFRILNRPLAENRPFVFGALGDRGSRKGDSAVWQAFYKAFGDNKDVRLCIKCRPDAYKFMDLSNSDRRLSIWREDSPSLSDYFSSIDCFVFPSRGEGFGLPPREAAAMAIPVIATQWGGLYDASNWSIPLTKFTMTQSPLESKGDWAWQDIDELVEAMKHVYNNRVESKKRALEHATYLRENCTWEHSAQALIKLIREYN